MGGGGPAPEPKKFVSPPIDNSPATNPIPNFFAQRQAPLSPYEIMAMLQAQQPQQGPFGQPIQPRQFQMPPMGAPQALPPQAQAPAVAPPAAQPTEMTKEEALRRARLGKGQR